MSTIAPISIILIINLAMAEANFTATKRFAFFSVHVDSWLIIKETCLLVCWSEVLIEKLFGFLFLVASLHAGVILSASLDENLLEVRDTWIDYAEFVLSIMALSLQLDWRGSFCNTVLFSGWAWLRWIDLLRWRYPELPGWTLTTTHYRGSSLCHEMWSIPLPLLW